MARKPINNAPLSLGFSQRLKETRLASKLTMAELAAAVGYQGKQMIGHLESGRNAPTIAICEELAAALNVRPAWLAYGDGDP